jgi:hypothetical protein
MTLQTRVTIMHYAKAFKFGFTSLSLVVAFACGSLLTAEAQETQSPPAKKQVRSGRDPFKRYEPPVVTLKKVGGLVVPPSLQERIEQYRAQKVAAMNAHLPAPKPTTALLLSEIQVIGISRTPRGYASIIEATPIKMVYVMYPGERLYDGQLVAIEDARLVFRHETVWSDGRHERTVEMKALRQSNPVDAMTAVKAAPASAPVAETEKKPEDKASATDKP